MQRIFELQIGFDDSMNEFKNLLDQEWKVVQATPVITYSEHGYNPSYTDSIIYILEK